MNYHHYFCDWIINFDELHKYLYPMFDLAMALGGVLLYENYFDDETGLHKMNLALIIRQREDVNLIIKQLNLEGQLASWGPGNKEQITTGYYRPDFRLYPTNYASALRDTLFLYARENKEILARDHSD
jgi:hypothetical protein